MAAANTVDTILAIRATDLSSRPIKDVIASVNALIAKLKDQTDAAKLGKGSAKEFADTLNSLERAAVAVGKQQGKLAAFSGSLSRMAEAAAKVKDAKTSLDAFKAGLAGGEVTTVKQSRAIERLEKALAAAEKRLAGATKTNLGHKTALERIGIEADKTAQAETRLAASLLKIGQNIGKGEKLERGFADALAEGAAGIRANKEALDARNKSVRDAVKLAGDRAKIRDKDARDAGNLLANSAVQREEEQRRSNNRKRADDTRSAVETENAIFAEQNKRLAADEKQQRDAASRENEERVRTAYKEEDAARKVLSDAVVRREEEERKSANRKREDDVRSAVEAENAIYEEQNRRLLAAETKRTNAISKENEERIRGAFADQDKADKLLSDAVVKREEEQRKSANRKREDDTRDAVETQNAVYEEQNKRLLAAETKRINAVSKENEERVRGAFEDQDKADRLLADAAVKRREKQRDADNRQREEEIRATFAANAEVKKLEDKDTEDKKRAANDLANFRKLADEAVAKNKGLGQVGGNITAQPVRNQIGSNIGDIINPAQAATRTLKGLEDELERVSGGLDEAGKNADSYRASLVELTGIQSSLASKASLLDQFRAQRTATLEAGNALNRAKQSVDDYARQIQSATAPSKELADNLRQAQAAVAAASTAYERNIQSLRNLKQQLDVAGVSEKNLALDTQRLTQAANASAAAITKAKNSLMELKEASQFGGGRLNLLGLEPYELQNLSFQINDIFTQLASGTSISQTLSQQSGQIFQLFQGRILGFIGGLNSAVPVVAGAVAGLSALAIGFAAINRALGDDQAVRNFTAQIRLSADGANYQASVLAQAQIAARTYGVSFKEAGEAVSIFLKAGIDQSNILRFTKAAKDLADVTGKDVPEAAKILADGLTGGIEAIDAMIVAIGTLGAEEREEVRRLLALGDAEAARRFAAEKSFEVLAKGAADMRGPWRDATKALNLAYNTFMDSLANSSAIQSAIRALTGLLNLVSRVTVALGGLSGRAAAAAAGGAEQVAATAKSFEGERDRLIKLRDSNVAVRFLAGSTTKNTEDRITQLDEQIAALGKLTAARDTDTKSLTRNTGANQASITAGGDLLRQQQNEIIQKGNQDLRGPAARADIDARTKAFREAKLKEFQDRPGNITSTPDLEKGLDLAAAAFKAAALRELAQAEETDKNKAESAARSAASRAKAAANAAEAAANKERSAAEGLANDLASLNAKTDGNNKQSLDSRLKAVDETYAKIDAKIEAAKRAGVTSVNGLSLEQFKAEFDAAKEREKQFVTIKSFEDDYNALLAVRKERYAAVNDELATGGINAAEAFTRVKQIGEETGVGIRDLAKKTVEFAKALGGVNPSPALQALIAKRGQAAEAEPGRDRDALEQLKAQIAASKAAVRELVADRDAVVAAQNSLVEGRVISSGEAEARIREAFEATTRPILDQNDALRKNIGLLQEAGGITPTKAAAEIGNTRKIDADALKGAETSSTRLRKNIEDTVATNLVGFADEAAEAFGRLAAGTASVKDTVGALARSFASFVAETLKGIALMILKEQALNAVRAIGKAIGFASGVAHSGGVVGSIGVSRSVDPAIFANAPRLHSGGIIGLQPDEVPTILQRGEEVLSRDNPRNILNNAANNNNNKANEGTGEQGIRNVLAIGEQEIASAMSSAPGERVVLNIMRRNLPTLKKWL